MVNLPQKNKAAFMALLGVFLILISRVLYFYQMPDTVLPEIITDDAFYYIQIAKHRAFDHVWTFDGTTLTTGFHPLHAYFLVGLFKVFGEISLHTLFLIVGIFTATIISISAYITYKAATLIDQKKSLVPFIFLLPQYLLCKQPSSWNPD